MSVELQDYFSSEEDLEEIYTKKRKKHYHGFIQDIEIQRNEFLLLMLIYLSIASIATLTLDLGSYYLGNNLISGLNAQNLGLIVGFCAGLVFSGFLSDCIHKRLSLLQYLLIVEIGNLIIQINMLAVEISIMLYNFFSFFLTGFTFVVMSLMFTVLFLEYSSILERGRVYSYLIMAMIIITMIIAVLSHVIATFLPIFLYLPLIPSFLTIYYIQQNKSTMETCLLQELRWEEKHINPIVVKYGFFIFFFALTVGVAMPIQEIEYVFDLMVNTDTISPEVLIIFSLLILISSLTVLIIGSVFDFKGRLVSLSSVILIISVCSVLYFLRLPILYLNEIIIVSSVLAIIMSITLLLGDVTKRKNYGRVITIGFSVCLAGLYLGLMFKNIIPLWLPQNSTVVLLSIIYLSSVLSLTILVNSNETLPHKEKEWFESLVHLYIIHKSGILLYDYEFSQQEDKIESDLVSGGIIGLTSLLKEIVKGEERLRIIDHGDMKLMFKYSPMKDVIFVLVIREDLLILRDKLDEFSKDFIETYKQQLDTLEYVRVDDWMGVSKLIEKYFERKYFEFAEHLLK
ncbi:MAG: hypothetical protein EU544_05950 [Promethearchaeota archaeon]|nr:MAG: hypothetical protein EU544_05950 [Candidatus Lokiarchaeota archaeon]